MSCGIRRILQFQEAIRYQEIKVIDSLGNDITMQCQYSWSSDGVCWTNWVIKGLLQIMNQIFI